MTRPGARERLADAYRSDGDAVLRSEQCVRCRGFDAPDGTDAAAQPRAQRNRAGHIRRDLEKNFEAKQLQLEIDRQKRFAELAQAQEVAGREAEPISIAQKSEEQLKAEASVNHALAEAVTSEQAVKTAEEVAKATTTMSSPSDVSKSNRA